MMQRRRVRIMQCLLACYHIYDTNTDMEIAVLERSLLQNVMAFFFLILRWARGKVSKMAICRRGRCAYKCAHKHIHYYTHCHRLTVQKPSVCGSISGALESCSPPVLLPSCYLDASFSSHICKYLTVFANLQAHGMCSRVKCFQDYIGA